MAEPKNSPTAADDAAGSPDVVFSEPAAETGPVVAPDPGAAPEPPAAPEPATGTSRRRVDAVPIVVAPAALTESGTPAPDPAPEPAPAAPTATAPTVVASEQPAPAAETVPIPPLQPTAGAVAAAPVADRANDDDDDDDDDEPDPAAWASPPPKERGNRLFGTFVVLLAAGIFEALYLLVLAILIAVVDGPSVIGQAMASFAQSQIVWLPVLLFFVFFELLTLFFNRSGRLAYVLGSLIVGAIVYAGTVGVILLIELPQFQGDGAALAATTANLFGSPVIIAAGFVAREVMLWTGLAVGARGSRVKERNRAARAEYDAALESGHPTT